MSDMATMPIRDLITEVRAQLKESNDFMKILTVGVFMNRLENQQNLIDELKEEIVRCHNPHTGQECECDTCMEDRCNT